MGALVQRKGPQGSPKLERESYPSPLAPRDFYARDAARQRSAGRHAPAEDREGAAGNCTQCGAFLLPEEAEECWHCESDNPQGRRLNRAG